MPRSLKIFKWIILIGCNVYIVAALGVPFYHDYTDATSEYKKLNDEGIETTAKVTHMRISRVKNTSYEITYVFEANGVPYTEVTWANTRRNKSLTEGDLVQIRYAASDPTISEIIGNEQDLSLPFRPYSYGVLACFGILILSVPLLDLMDWRQKRAAARRAARPIIEQ
ncbi:MAG: hypothetical protein K8L91_19120 [Anaerolineae bacterium]|nr:hypothetical protein [Anaerolineae bacterium]